MIGLDTNVVVRYIMRDDLDQTALADSVMGRLTARNRGFISVVVLAELWWVLVRSYRRTPVQCRQLFSALVDTDELCIGSEASVRIALDRCRDGADFADALITMLAAQAGCDQTVTFDKGAAKHGGMVLLGDRTEKVF